MISINFVLKVSTVYLIIMTVIVIKLCWLMNKFNILADDRKNFLIFTANNKKEGKMKKNYTNSFCKVAVRLLIYGLFACLCHALFIFLYALHSSAEHSFLYINEVTRYMLEHSLMSVLIVISGAVLLSLESKNKGT